VELSAWLGCDDNGFGSIVGVVNKGSTLGRNVELMSPIPTKKSSAAQIEQIVRDRAMEWLTWNDFNEIRTPFPDVCTVVDDDDHGRITRK
jgi:hypothetical protein